MKRYKEINHTGDIGVEIYGKTREELFKNAAMSMFTVIYGRHAEHNAKGAIKKELCLEAEDEEGLLVAWLNELLFLSYTNHAIFNKFDIKTLTETEMEASINGEKSTGKIEKEIKAATYHDVSIEMDKGIYKVTVIFDV